MSAAVESKISAMTCSIRFFSILLTLLAHSSLFLIYTEGMKMVDRSSAYLLMSYYRDPALEIALRSAYRSCWRLVVRKLKFLVVNIPMIYPPEIT